MASLGQISVGMSLDATQFDKGLGYVQSEVRTLAGDIDKLGGMIKGALGGFAAASTFKQVGEAIFSMSKEAAHAEDVIASFGVVFGREASSMVQFSEQLSTKFSIGLNSILDAEGRIGSIFQGANLAPSKVAAYTRQIAQLAVDYRALKGVQLDSAFEKFASGLVGEQEPLRALGINFNEAAIKAEALRLGLGGVNGELTEGEKVQARFAVITKQGAVALGSAVREIDSAAAKIEALSGAFENLRIAIGKATAPAVGKGAGWITSFINQATTGVKILTGQLDDQLKILNGGPRALLGAVGRKVAGGAMNVLDRDKETKRLQQQARFEALMKNPASFFAPKNPSSLFGLAVKPDDAGGVKLLKNLANAVGVPGLNPAGIARFAAGAAAGNPAILGRALGFGGGLGVPGLAGAASMFAGGKIEPHAMGFAGLARAGSREAQSTILRSRYGGSKDPIADNTKKTAENTAKVVGGINKVADSLRALAATKPQLIEI